MIEALKRWARRLKRDAHAVYLVARDPRTPWYVKALAAFVAGYALSAIDLIPDFIPVLGYLDDLMIIPLGLWLVIRLVPPEIMAEHRATADRAAEKPTSRAAVVVIGALWAIAAALLVWATAHYIWT